VADVVAVTLGELPTAENEGVDRGEGHATGYRAPLGG
jgi:hypothetical protein